MDARHIFYGVIMKVSSKFVLSMSVLALAACGGGGGGGGSSAGDAYSTGSSSNSPPTINNTVLNISVMENQTSAFQIEASDADGDTITYNVGGEDQEFFDVSTSGVVTFKVAPDFENPSDANADNVYEISGIASDSGSMTSKDFTVTVTNDPSDDVTTDDYDGIYIGTGPIQGATVCIEVTSYTCTGAQYTTTTAQDGTFSLTFDSDTTDIVIRGEGGFDPVTNLQFDDDDTFSLSQPVTDQNLVVSPLSAFLYEDFVTYEELKSRLGLDPDFMIRFDNPFSNLNSAINNKAAVVNAQVLVLYKLLMDLHPTLQ